MSDAEKTSPRIQGPLASAASSTSRSRFPPSTDGRDLAPLYGRLLPDPGSPAGPAGQRFAQLPPAAQHAWLARHLADLRAGRISLAQLP